MFPIRHPTVSNTDSNNIIQGIRACQTKDAVWLAIVDIYEKLQRPNIYDIGGSHIDNVPDYWFTCKMEKAHGIFLLHLFASNHMEGTYTLGVSADSIICPNINVRDRAIRLTKNIETYQFCCSNKNQCYITTYAFRESDVEEVLKGKVLCIAVQLSVKMEIGGNSVKEEKEIVQMLHDNAELLKYPIGSDFIIESADGVEFSVHRVILSLHSEVFKAMLDGDMAESRNGRVKLVDVCTDDIKIMVEFLYTGTIKVIEEINFGNVLMLADRYNLVGLRELCGNILIDQLGPDTALDIVVLADRFLCSSVKQMAFQYIKHNKNQFKDTDFDQIDNLSLMKELCVYLL